MHPILNTCLAALLTASAAGCLMHPCCYDPLAGPVYGGGWDVCLPAVPAVDCPACEPVFDCKKCKRRFRGKKKWFKRGFDVCNPLACFPGPFVPGSWLPGPVLAGPVLGCGPYADCIQPVMAGGGWELSSGMIAPGSAVFPDGGCQDCHFGMQSFGPYQSLPMQPGPIYGQEFYDEELAPSETAPPPLPLDANGRSLEFQEPIPAPPSSNEAAAQGGSNFGRGQTGRPLVYAAPPASSRPLPPVQDSRAVKTLPSRF